MQAGELFVSLGVKGSEKTLGALTSIVHRMDEAKGMSLEAKAAIVGAVYAFEHMMAKSSQVGTDLTNFSLLTGQSAANLQKWQWAAMQAGDRSEDFTKSVLSMQNAINKMVVNKSAPEFFGMISKNMNKAGDLDLARFQKDSFYAMSKVQEAAQNMRKNMQGSLATYMLKSLGLGDTTIAAMYRNAFRPEMIAKAPHYSESQIKSLDRANIAWANLGNQIELAFGRFNAQEGVKLVSDITKITTAVIQLTEAFVHFAEKIKIFTFISEGMQGIATGLQGIGTVFDYFFGNKQDQAKASNKISDFTHGFKDVLAPESGMERQAPHGFNLGHLFDGFKSIMGQGKEEPLGFMGASFLKGGIGAEPKIPNQFQAPSTNKETNVDLKQTVIFQGHHEAPQRTVDSLKKQVGDYFKQSSAKNVGG